MNVTADTPLLDTSSVSSGQNFDSRMVEGLPMFSNMPIMLTRFASGVNPSTNQSLVSQGFADGTTQAAGGAVGGVGSNNYSIDGATNNGSGRRIAASPNSDMIQEMRVESSNFDASVGHGTGLQISMMTRAGANQFRGTANYQYWTNKFNELNPSQRLTFTPAGKELYESGRSHNMALTLGGPVVIPKIVDGRNKLFFFGSYSYVNDFIPGKNQALEHGTGECGAAQRRLLRSAQAAEPGAVSDLRSADGAARSGESEPIHPHPVPEQHHSGEPDRESALQPVQADGAAAQSEPHRERDDANRQLLPGRRTGQAGQLAVRRPRGLQHVRQRPLLLPRLGQHVHRAGERLDLRGARVRRPALDRSVTLQLGGHRQLDARGRHDASSTPRSRATASSRTTCCMRLHEYKPTDMGLPGYLDAFCAAQNDCMLPAVNIGGYQGISQGAVLRRHDHEPSGHGQPHAGSRARTRCAGASMRDSRSAGVVRVATRPGSSRSPTSSPVRPATTRSSHRATSG